MAEFEEGYVPELDGFSLDGNPTGSPEGDSPEQQELESIMKADPALGSLPEDDPRRNPSRQEFWQRQYSLERENRLKMQEQMNQLSGIAPVAKLLTENPKALAKLLGVEEPVEKKEQAPAKPERPKRPDSYSREEAMGDSNSASAKYEAALLQYQEQMADYAATVADMSERKLRAAAEQHENAQKVAEQHRAGAQILAARYGYSPEMIADFFKMVDEGKSTIDDLVAAHQYRLTRSKKTNSAGRPTREELDERERRFAVPTPGGVGGGVPARVGDDFSKAFSGGLVAGATKFQGNGR